MSRPVYNLCKTCGAKDGRAGDLFNGECLNCYKTRMTGEVSIHAWLPRTDEEISKTIAILERTSHEYDGTETAANTAGGTQE